MGIKSKLKAISRNRSNSPRKQKILGNEGNKAISEAPAQFQSVYAGRKEFSQEGNLNFRVLAFAGGISVILTSILSIGIHISHLDYIQILMYVYTLLFGILICILEGQFLGISILNGVRSFAIEAIPILKYLWGRGALYILCGSVQLSHPHLMNIASGTFLIGVGCLFVVIGMYTRRRMKKLKKALKDTRSLKRHFNRFDRDGDGVLDMDEFGAFVASLTGDDLDEDELEGSFGIIDSQGKGYITLDELQKWMKGFKAEEENEETGGGTGNHFQLM